MECQRGSEKRPKESDETECPDEPDDMIPSAPVFQDFVGDNVDQVEKQIQNWNIESKIDEHDQRLLHDVVGERREDVVDRQVPSAPPTNFPDLASDLSKKMNLEEKDLPVVEECHHIAEEDHRVLSPSAPPHFSEMSPYFQVHRELEIELENENSKASNERGQSQEEQLSVIKPFTEGQLFNFYEEDEMVKRSKLAQDFLLSQNNLEKHELHELLINYRRVRANLISNERAIKSLKENSEEIKEKLWTFEEKTVQESGECHDLRIVSAAQKFKVSHFDPKAASDLHKTMKELKTILTESYALEAHKAVLMRLKIEKLLCFVIMADDKNDLLECLNVLFNFHRRLTKDDEFITDIQGWIDQLVAKLINGNDADLNDHAFLMNHVMRCQGGVGKWAAKYIQPRAPETDNNSSDSSSNEFKNPLLQGLLALLATILCPVEQREEFIKELKITASPAQIMHKEDNKWTVIDSEGEEDEDPEHSWSLLRENDLVNIMNQIPIGQMFKFILKMEKRDGKDFYDPTLSSEQSFLTLFAFATKFVYLMKQGLTTFNTPRYRNFAKRLGLLIRHTVLFVSDHFLAFKEKRHGSIHPAMLLRIQVEYDSFFLRAIKCIFSAQKLGGWQYLTLIPYGTISINMLWRIFYVLHLESISGDENFAADIKDWSSSFEDEDIHVQFEEKLCQAADTERHYLLTAFSAMAVSRDSNNERDFIEHAALDIFRAGFARDFSDEILAKGARNLLVDITTKHPFVISLVLGEFQNERTLECSGTRCYYLVNEMPFSLWRPKESDMNQILNWLADEDLSSTRSKLARMVISKMNWECKPEQMVLPWQFHQRVAIAIVEAAMRYAPESAAMGGIIQSSILRQVSNIASVVRHQTPEQLFLLWAWETITKLRLHSVDQEDSICRKSVAGTDPDGAFGRNLDFELEASIFDSVVKGVVCKNPLACFVALHVTQLGHSVPEICTRGFDLMLILSACGRYDHLLECVMKTTPLFFPSPESVLDCEPFNLVLQSVMAADSTVLKMATDLVITNGPGPVMIEFGNMVQKQLLSYKRYGFSDAMPVISFWFKTLTNLPSWTKDANILYILNILSKESFFISSHFNLLSSLLDEKFNGVLSKGDDKYFWMMSGKSANAPVMPTYPDFPYLAFFVLKYEEYREKQLEIWSNLVEELNDNSSDESSSNNTLEQAAKNVSKKLKIPKIDTNYLMIYRWSKQLLDSQDGEQMQIIFAQKFFENFLSRPKPDGMGHEFNGVGMKLFDGMVNSRYLRSVKTKIGSIANFYEEKQNETKNEKNETENANRMLLFKTFSIWLQDPNVVLDGKLHIASLSPLFMTSKLAILIGGKSDLWYEYLSKDQAFFELEMSANDWEKMHFRLNSSDVSKQLQRHAQVHEPEKEIVKRLNSYDSPVPPPRLVLVKSPVPAVPTVSNITEESLSNLVTPMMTTLRDFSSLASNWSMSMTSAISSYMELVPRLYENVHKDVVVRVCCQGSIGPKKEKNDCSGGAAISLEYEEAKLQEGINYKVLQKQDDFKALLENMLQPPPNNFLVAVAQLEELTSSILKQYGKLRRRDETESNRLQNLGISLFYQLVDTLLVNGENSTSQVNRCAQLRHFLSITLDTLGSVVIANHPNQCKRLAKKILSNPNCHQFLLPSFTPNMADMNTFLELYRMINELPQSDVNLAFVLLSKMHVEQWLDQNSPPMNIRSRLISQIARALKKTGSNPDEDQTRVLVHGIHRQHLVTMAFSDFPKHYDEVNFMLLTLNEAQTVDPTIWYDLLNKALTYGCRGSMEIKERLDQTKESHWGSTFKDFANHQVEFHLDEVEDFFEQFSNHFSKERKEVGLHGLFTKYGIYAKPLAAYFSLHGHLFVYLFLMAERSSHMYTPSDKVLQTVWNKLSKLYAPWLFPLTSSERQETAAWIRDLAQKSQTLLPWAPGEARLATSMFNSFISVIKFIENSLPAETNVMTNAFQCYATFFASTNVKDYILEVAHASFLQLPWKSFHPNLADVETMARIMDTYLPSCHSFLGKIFTDVEWSSILNEEANLPMIPILLRIIVKLAAEPNIRQLGKLQNMIKDMEHYPWWIIEAVKYESVIQWYVMSSDPKVIVSHNERHALDSAVFKLLKMGAGHFYVMNDEILNPDSSYFKVPKIDEKRLNFIRCCVRHLIACGNKHKNFLASHQEELKFAIEDMLETVELVTVRTVYESHQLSTCIPMVKEILGLLNSNKNSVLPSITMDVLKSWLTSHFSRSPILIAILKLMGSVIVNPSQLALVQEQAVEAFYSDSAEDQQVGNDFKKQVREIGGDAWQLILPLVSLPQEKSKCTELLDVSVKQGLVLNLYLHLKKKQPFCQSLKEEDALLSTIILWLRHLTYNASVEPKLCLLYYMFFFLSQRQMDHGGSESNVLKHVLDFVEIVGGLARMQSAGWNNILGAIGLGNSYQMSPRGRFLALSIVIFARAQILKGGRIYLRTDSHDLPEGKSFEKEYPNELKSDREELAALKTQKAFFGLTDLIDWVLLTTRDTDNDFRSAQDFLTYLIRDKLYVEKYLHLIPR